MISKFAPVISFFVRYWFLLLATAFGFFVSLNDSIFKNIGTLGYVWGVFFLAITCAFFARHTIFRRTIELYVGGDDFVKEWNSLTPSERQRLTFQYTATFIIAAAIVAAGVSK